MKETKEKRSVKDLLQENEELQARIEFLQQENKRLLKEHRNLTDENSFLKRQNTALKMRCSNYCLKVKDLENKIADLRFTYNYLTSEEAGHALARSLLGGK